MGPNSGGGRRNKDNNNPGGCTRNRFSNWKPPTKSQKEKFTKQSENRAVEQHRAETGQDRSESHGGLTVVKAASQGAAKGGGKAGSTQVVGDLVTIHATVVAQLLALFESDKPPAFAGISLPGSLTIAPAESGAAASQSTVKTDEPAKSNRGKIVNYDTAVPPAASLVHDLSQTKKAPPISVPTQATSGKDTLERRQIRSTLGQWGFEMEEVSRLLALFRDIPVQYNDMDVLLAMLMLLTDQPVSAPLSAKPSTTEIDLSANEELFSELDILSSIYMENVTYRSAVLLGKNCALIDLHLPIENDILSSIGAVSSAVNHVVHVRMVISDVSTYPSMAAPLYGWVIPHSPSAATVHGAQAGGSTPLLPAHLARELSMSAMTHIRGYQMQFEAPAAFEFIQHIRDRLSATLSSVPAQSPAPDGAAVATAGPGITASLPGGKSGGAPSAPKKAVVVELSQEAPEGPPPMPPKPMTQHMQSMEYRSALSAAFSAGLVGAAARAKVHADLEFVLPKSTLEALRIEEAYHEEALNRACSIENLPTRVIIEATRVLTEELQVNKAKAKALIANAKDAMVAQRDYFARSEDSMRNKLVAGAVAIFRERLQRKEEKKQQASRRKAPGLTLRDAFARRRAREQATSAIEQEDAAQGFAQEPVAEYVEEEPYYEEEEEEVVEEVPLDPAQVQAALEAERERKRLRDIESAQMQKRFKEKKRLPKYVERMQQRSTLPAYQMKDQIVDAIDKNSVVVISGDTGCGKTTQVPQFVLDEWIERGRGAECSIIVTQPRRISAMSVAERIAHERVEQVGQSAGYHIRLEVKKGPGTRLLLMTTGVLLRMLQMEGNLDNVSHVFVDEVHERDLNTDFLLIILKKLLAFRPDLKIVLMSATLNANLFLDYFRGGGGKASKKGAPQAGISSCALLTIPGRAFPVTSFYLEDAFQATGFEFAPTSPCLASTKGGSKGRKGPSAAVLAEEKRLKRQFIETLRQGKKYSEKTIGNLELVDESIVNADLIVKLTQHIIASDEAGKAQVKKAKDVAAPDAAPAPEFLGAILIFVPGLANIQDVIDALKASPMLSSKHSNVRILPLHSSLSSQEQNAVFQTMPPGCRKIVVSTNIAETSVTIEDVVYVIDTCRVKENSYDEESHMNVLEEMWLSKANARQRRGRAGRVRSGVCYHLVSKFTMDRLQDYMLPEMLKMSLEDTILQILALDLGDPYKFLRGAITPPEDVAITNGVLFLESLSAVVVNNFDTSLNVQGKDITIDLDCEITPLGYHLAALPINPRIGKLILYGVLLHCIDPILTIASTESVKSVFNSPFGAKELADEAKLKFLEGNSDLLTSANAFAVWKSQYDSSGGHGKRGGGGSGDKPSEGEFCRTNFLSMNSLRLVDQMRQQFLSLLKDIGFMPQSVTLANIATCPQNAYGSHTGLIKSAICAGLSPNILLAPDLSGKNSGKKLAEIALQSRSQGTMKVHPSSVMSEARYLDSGYIVYLEAMRTSQVYVRDVTTIPSLVLVMFSGRSKVNPYNGAVVVDGWLRFRTPDLRISKCIARVRDSMDDAFMQKVLDPASDATAQWLGVLKCLERGVSST